jgi:rsbT co-antagonist protein RsbR
VSNAGWIELLTTDQDELLSRWTTQVATALGSRLSRQEIERETQDLYKALVSAAERAGDRGGDLLAEEYDELRALLAELSHSRAINGFSPSETATSVFGLKDAVLSTLDGQSSVEAYMRFAALSRFVDAMGLFTFETFSRSRENVIVEQSAQLMELSTPVVKLWDGIVAVPLVGTLDSARTQVVMEKLLQALVDTGSAHAIIDITGVPAVDTQVAQHLLKTVMAAQLMGAECIVSGIRPQIAQTIVALGIEFGEIITKSSMADALLVALRRTGVDIVRKAPRREY